MFKRALIFSVVFTFLIIIVLFFLFDSVAVKDLAKRIIITQAYYKLNTEIEIGDVRFSYFRPAVLIKDLALKKADEQQKIELLASEALVSFHPLSLITGEVSISALKLVSPKLSMEIYKNDLTKVSFDGLDVNKIQDIDIISMINKVQVIDAEIDLKIYEEQKDKHIHITSPDLDLLLKKGFLFGHSLILSAKNISSPLEYISDFDLQIETQREAIRINRFNVNIFGGHISSRSGYIYNLDDFSKLNINVFWTADLNLSDLKKYSSILKFKESEIPIGLLTGSGRYLGNPFKIMESATIDLDLKIRDFVWGIYDVPKVELALRLFDNELTISKIDVSDGFKSIMVNEAKLLLESPYTIKGTGLVKDVELSRYLELFDINRCLSYFNVEGPFTFSGTLEPEFRISALFDLKVRDFWVLEKKGLEPNKANSVLDFKKGSVYGFIHFSEQGAYFDNVVAKSEENSMVVEGWIKSDSTVDINVVSDDFSMDTYGRIAELPLKGKGLLMTKLIVDDNGDFKNKGSLKFKNVELLNEYYMGDLETKIIYDGQSLYFQDVIGKLGNSIYYGHNKVDFDDPKGTIIKGGGYIQEGYSEDIYRIFKDMPKLPGNPSGLFSAEVSFEGYPAWSAIRIDSRIKFKDLEYLSERFDELYADFLWDKGNISFKNLYLTKGGGKIVFSTPSPESSYDFKIDSRDLNLRDFFIFTRKTMNVGGDISAGGSLKIDDKKAKGNINLDVSGLTVLGEKLDPSSLQLNFDKTLSLDFDLFQKQGIGKIIRLDKNLYRLTTKFNNFNIRPISLIFIDNLEDVNTLVKGELELDFSLPFVVERASLKFTDINVSSGTLLIKNQGEVNINYQDQTYSIEPFGVLTSSGNDNCKLDFSNDEKKILLNGCVVSGLMLLLKEYISGASGKFEVDLAYNERFSGRVSGTISPRDVQIMPAVHGLGNISLFGRIDLNKSFIKLDSLVASSGEARVSFFGGGDFDEILKLKFKYPKLKIGANFEKVYYEYPEGFKGKWSGEIQLSGDKLPYYLSGKAELFESSYRKDFNIRMMSFKKTKTYESFFIGKQKDPVLDFNLKLKSAQDILIKNNIFDGDIVFDLNVKGTENNPLLVGSVDILRGKITYMDNTFDLTSGRFRFKEDTQEPTIYQLDAESKISDYIVYLKLVSENDELRFKLNSIPPLTEDKIIALMATGEVQTDFSESGGYGMTTGTGGQLVTEGLGVTGTVREKTGVGFRLKSPKGKDATLPDIELQKDLTSDIKLIYGKSLDEAVNKQEVNVQYDLSRNTQLKLLLEEEERKENVSKEPTSAGVDIKFKFDF
jgi:hypothetical protein